MNVSAFNANDPYELLIAQMIRIERQPQYRLQDERDEQNRIKKVIGDFDTKLSSLYSMLSTFKDPFQSPFYDRKAEADKDAPFTVSANNDAGFGGHEITVQRLAATDTRLSKQLTVDGASLRSFFDSNGAQTFEIEVASPTDADPDNRALVAVTVDPTGSTDEEILREISTAINTAMSDAAAAGDIKNTEKAQGAVIRETSGTVRMSLRSGQTGFENRIGFGADSSGGLLALLDVGNTNVVAGTAGGMVKDVGTDETDSELNAMFILDGITLYRSKNAVADALDGVTLNLKKISESTLIEKGNGNPKETVWSPSSFSVVSDIESIEADVTSFIEKYNTILGFVSSKTGVDGELKVRGDFAGDPTFSVLRMDLRANISRQVAGQPDGAPRFIGDLGISIERDGTLSLSDASKLKEAIEKDPDAVYSLFGGADGIATRLESQLERFRGSDGVIETRKNSIDERVRRLDSQIADWDARMLRREDVLRQQFAKMQETLALLQGQQNYIGSFMGYGF